MVTLTRVPMSCFATRCSMVARARVESHAADHDRSELREIDPPVALDRQLIGRRLVAVELDIQRVARTDDVVRWDLNIRHRAKVLGTPSNKS